MRNTATGLLRLLLAAGLLLPVSLHEAVAASWQWTAMPRRDRITIALDAPAPALSFNRSGSQSITLALPAAPTALTMQGTPPGDARFLDGVSINGKAIQVTTRTPGFGYIVTTPAKDRIVIDLFEDPLGNQWQPDSTTPDKAATGNAAAKNAVTAPGHAAGNAGTTSPSAQAGQATAVTRPADAKVSATAPPQPAAASGSLPPGSPPAVAGSKEQEGNAGAKGLVERVITDASGKGLATGQLAPDTPATQEAAALTSAQPAPMPQPHMGADKQRAFFTVPYALRGRVNFGGPEAWPSDAAVSATTGAPPSEAPATTTPPAPVQITAQAAPATGNIPVQGAPPAADGPNATPAAQSAPQLANATTSGAPYSPVQPAASAAPPPAAAAPAAPGTMPEGSAKTALATNGSKAENATQVVYVDAKGNPVPPPPNPEQLMSEARALISSQNWGEALARLMQLKGLPDLSPSLREETLYLISDALFSQNKDKLGTAFDTIMDATSEAMNYNLRSPRVPLALLRLGLLNLRSNNTREATAYFNLLKKQYPQDDNIPLAYFYLGEDYFKKGKFQDAADQFQFILQNYPESRYVRESSVFLARSLHSLGYLEHASAIMDFIDKRWPRLYLEAPDYLLISADVQARTKRLDEARNTYWTYYNINPDGRESDIVLAHLGDIYARQGHAKAAGEIYGEAVRRFPDKDGGLIAMLRIAEQGIFDTPDVASMFTVFGRPDGSEPAAAYKRIINDHPKSALVPMARLKLGMWHLWNKQYPEALAAMAEFAKQHDPHPLLGKAKEVALASFGMIAADAVRENNFQRVQEFWESYPLVREQAKAFGPELRLALGMSFWKLERPGEALELLEPLLQQAGSPHGEAALNLALSIQLATSRWQQIVDLTGRLNNWKLSPDGQRQRDYALALAHENLDQPGKALPLWERLDRDKNLPDEQKAYVTFFLSRDAERKRDLQNAYLLNKDALTRFVDLATKTPEKADNARIRDCIASLMDITEAAGRTRESLDWSGQYAHYIKEGTPEHTAMRYRVARLYRKLGEVDQWKKMLDGIIATEPESVYGRMAASELRTYDVTRGISKFTGGGI